jgi:hypothetical protein
MSDSISISRSTILSAARARQGVMLDFDMPDSSPAEQVQKIIVAAGVATLVVAAAKLYFAVNSGHQKIHHHHACPEMHLTEDKHGGTKTVPLIETSESELTDDDGAVAVAEWDMLSPSERRFTPPTSIGVFACPTPTEGLFVAV